MANESRELILNCCTEFIHLLSSEGNEVCNQKNKKTINAEHILEALDRLGFKDYKREAEAVLHDCKQVAAKRRRQSTRLENLGIPEEELLRQQQVCYCLYIIYIFNLYLIFLTGTIQCSQRKNESRGAAELFSSSATRATRWFRG